MKHLRCITINTDASHHPVKKAGGYAFYIVCDLFKIQKSGAFKVDPLDSIDAEMKCMANALHTLLMQKELPTCDLIVINSDCLFSFSMIGLRKKGIGKTVALILRDVRNRMAWKEAVLPSYEFRHVKAHSGKSDARSWVNEWCDKEAKKWMRIKLEEKQKPK
jgi:ribonuclease HI